MNRRVALIANPRAGGGTGQRVLAETLAALERGGLEVSVRATERPRHAVELARQAAEEEHRWLVALGGDGTLNEVIAGVLARGPAPDDLVIGQVPAGRANSFARDFGVTLDTRQRAIERIITGETRPIDIARVAYVEGGLERTRYFVNVFGVGFMAEVAETANRHLKRLGMRGYSVAVFLRLLRLGASPTRLELEGADGPVVREQPLTLAAVCNSQWTAENMWIAPKADPSDGELDVLTLGAVSRLELLRLFVRIFNGAHLKHPAVSYTRAKRISITPGKASPLLADGEVFGSTPVTVEVLPGAVRMAV